MKLFSKLRINKRANKGAVLIITVISLAVCSLVCALLAIFVINGYRTSMRNANTQLEKVELNSKCYVVYGAFYKGIMDVNDNIYPQQNSTISNLTYEDETFSADIIYDAVKTIYYYIVDSTHYEAYMEIASNFSLSFITIDNI